MKTTNQRGAQRNRGVPSLQSPKSKALVLITMLALQLMTACASTTRDPFAKEDVTTSEYQRRLETKYKPWWASLTEEQRLAYRRLWLDESKFALSQMRLGAEMMGVIK